MCTCGIDMATQQPMPATTRTACRPLGVSPSDWAEWGAAASALTAPAALSSGGLRRSVSASGTMAAKQRMLAAQ